MPIKIGNTNIGAIYKGSTPIAKIYKGTTLLYENASWETFSQQYLYYTLIPQTINSKSVKNKVKISKIYGNGVIENQLVQNGNFEDSSVWTGSEGSTFTVANNTATFVQANSSGRLRQPVTTYANHKYLVSADIKATQNCTIKLEIARGWISISQSVTANVLTKVYGFLTPTSTTNPATEWFQIFANIATTFDVSNVTFVDLTLREGTGNEPTTLTDNRIQNILNRGYIPYNLGEYKGTDIGEFSSEPYNLFDEETELGAWNTTNGENVASNNQLRAKNDILVLPNTDYTMEYLGSVSGVSIWAGLLDENGSVIDGSTWGSAFSKASNFRRIAGTNVTISSFTTPSNAKYLRFYLTIEYGTTYLNNVCFHLTGTRTGYAEHKTFTPITFKAQLNGAINSHDTMEITKTDYVFTKNVGSVDLGSLSYQYKSDNPSNLRFISTTLSTMDKLAKPTQPDLLCKKYISVSGYYFDNNGTVDKIIRIDDDLGRFVIRDLAYTDGTTFKSALSGIYAYYPLATPQVITIPRKHLGIVDLGSLSWGTPNSIGRTGTEDIQSIIKKPSVNNIQANIYCSNYLSKTANQTYVGNIGISIQTNGTVHICDSSFVGKTANEIKALLSGTYLFYETENEVADILDTIDIESGGTITSNWFSWVENQIVYDGNFANGTNEWFCLSTVYSQSVTNNVMTVTKNASGAGAMCSKANSDITYTAGHKFIALAQVKPSRACTMNFMVSTTQTGQSMTANVWNTLSYFANPSSLTNLYFAIYETNNTLQVNDTVQIKNVMLIDLTLAGLEDATSINDPRIQYIINQGYIPTNTTGTLKSVDTEVLPNVELSIKCK